MSYPPPPTLEDEIAELKFFRKVVIVAIVLACIGALMEPSTKAPSTQHNASKQESQP